MRALTGIQPSGIAHLGNLFGAMFPIIDLAKEHEGSIIMLADLHTLTTVQNATQLRKNTFNMAVDLLALGLDPEKTIFFRQSDVPAHAELTWILSTITPMGLLQRAHSFKDKTAKGIEASTGLFTYPVLMAADILLYDADMVPVGKDQKQHLEITRDIGQKFNHLFGETFLLPEPIISEETAVVPGIDGEKMSKSYGNTIEIFADEKTLKKQIMSIVTDSAPVEAPKDPERNTIFQLYCLLASKEEQEVFAEQFRAGGLGYGKAKNILFEKANAFLAPLRAARQKIENDKEKVEKILEKGAEKARFLAEKKMQKVKRRVGLL
ncbi:tryptophan--tRNA ligase [Candidatus Peregrinibacteria bacterium]|nr:MAG: tryptophan--tRNA ligase [Candidatus Peregrinibacteria bacterium]